MFSTGEILGTGLFALGVLTAVLSWIFKVRAHKQRIETLRQLGPVNGVAPDPSVAPNQPWPTQQQPR